MSEQQFYINGNWYTYEEAHNQLGITRSRPESVTFLRDDFSEVTVRKDVDDNTFYDSENHVWHEDINEFCHRRLIADYIELETGIYIPEVSIGENGRLIMHNPIRYKNKLKKLIK